MLALGIVCGILEARTSGRASGRCRDHRRLCFAHHALSLAQSSRRVERDWIPHALDGSAPFYDTYRCADGKWISLGALEPQFYALLLQKCGLTEVAPGKQWDVAQWPAIKARVAALIAMHPRDEWCRLLEGSDVCFAPVLDLDEAPQHAQNRAHGTFVEVDGVTQPRRTAPRFSRTPAAVKCPPPAASTRDDSALSDWGFAADEISALRSADVLK